MTRIKTTMLLIALLLLATSAQASQQAYHWAVPSDGWEVHHYIVEIRTDAGEWILLSVEPSTNTVTLEFEDNVVYEIRVQAIDLNGHPGIWSEASTPYAYTKPGQAGKPWRE